MTDFAILYHTDAYSLQGKVMGRQSAGSAFLRAVAHHNAGKIWCYTTARADAQACAQALSDQGARTGVAWIPFSQPQRLAEPGILYRPDPIIEIEAWRRLSQADPRAYSLCGVTHTIASEGPMRALAGLPTAPLEPWDAIICTSRAVKASVRSLVEEQIDYLRTRTGATHFTLPQLPIIPLGVHCSDYRDLSKLRAEARKGLGIADDEVAIIFVGRLSFHGKAHPVPMFLALEACAKKKKIVLLQAGWYASDAIRDAFEADAKVLCPSLRILQIDARDQGRLRSLWSAADIFTSLSDNIQETFGLTPIEAMAAGLPVVVSDWDGYKDTVRDGIDGFRISTLTLPSGAGGELADRFEAGIDDYDRYCGYTSQLVAVNVAEAETAFMRLIEDPDLRRTMGEAGRRRASETLDWSVIFKSYLALWGELKERRLYEPTIAAPLTRRRRPERPDPFSLFASYPSVTVGPATEFRLRLGMSSATARDRKRLDSVKFASTVLPNDKQIENLLGILDTTNWTSYLEISERLADMGSSEIAKILSWLAKVGIVDFRKCVRET